MVTPLFVEDRSSQLVLQELRFSARERVVCADKFALG